MEMDTTRSITRLLRMEETTREAYDVAMGKLRHSKMHPSMARLRENHQVHAEGLRQMADETGGPKGDSAYDEYMDTVLDSVRQAKSFEGIFSSVRIAEAALKLEYEEMLRADLPEDVRGELREYWKDEVEAPNLLAVATHGLPQA